MYQKDTLERNITDLKKQINDVETNLSTRKNFVSPGQISAWKSLKKKLIDQLTPLKEKYRAYYKTPRPQS
jgi:flagellar capping protein FliD